MKNKPKHTSRPKKQPKSALKKTSPVKAALSGKKKKPEEKTGKNKIGTLDNAKRHKMERELRETKERLHLLSEAAEEGIAIHDKGVIIDANDALARIFGYELSEIIGMNSERFASPESWKVIQEHISKEYDKPYEGVGIRKDGSTFICSLVGKLYKYKGRALRLSAFHDITERKSMEEKLRFEEQRFRSFIEHSSDIIVFVNREGMVTYENPAVEKLLGFKAEERIGVKVFDRIHPDDLKFASNAFNMFTLNTSSKDINAPVRQIRLRHQDGSWYTFETSGSKLLHDNIVNTVIINLRDITERKQIEEALRQSEKKYRIILENIQEVYFEVNLAGNFTFFNDSVCRVLQYSRKELMGMNNRQYIDKEELKKVFKAYNKVYKTGKPLKEFGYWISRKDGVRRYVEGSVSLLKNSSGKPTGFRGIMNDFSERKQAEEKLREREKQYRTFFKTSRDCVFITSIDGSWIDMNDAAVELFGYSSRDELMRVKIPDLYAKPEDRTKHISTIIEQDNTRDYPVDLLRKDGKIINTLITSAVRYDEAGKTIELMGTIKDVTERKRAEESLKETELKFRSIFDFASDGILLAQSSDRTFFSPNEKICAMLGYTKEELLKFGVSDIHPEESIPYVNEQFKKLLEKEILVAQNIPLLKKDKTVFFADISASSITLDEKDYLVGIFRDITERKRSEEEIKSAKVFLDMIIDMSPFAMWISDKEGTITRANLSLYNTIDLTENEIVGKYNVLNDVNLEIQGVMPMVRAVFEKHEPARFIIPWKTAYAGDVDFKGARDMHIDVSMFPILNAQGELTNVVCQWVDITERKKIEKDLENSEELFRNLFQHHAAVKLIIDPDTGNIMDANEAALKYYGWSREQITHMKIQDINTLSQEEVKSAMRKVQTKKSIRFEFQHRRSDGSVRDVEVFSSNIKAQGKNILHTIVHDITERKKVEKELKKHREHLEELVHERTIKLEASNKELEAFSYSASHDLRAPLRTIEGFSQALLEDCEDKLDIQGKDYLIRIRAATRRMAELIEDLLQLSRITRTEINMEKVNLTRIARFVIDELQKSQPQRHVEIRIADGLEETADSRLMRIVLENLLGNAWKFTEKQAKAVIEFGCTKEGKKKVYFIRDNGVGFDMAYADKLFAPFQRLHTEDEFPGTGIGLATVRRIIHRHGGKVWTEGKTGKGATFYFSLNEK